MSFPQISGSELEIMRIIWANQAPALFASIMDALQAQGNRWKANTVLTFLTRLGEKGLLTITKQGRINVYHAACTEEEYLEAQAQSFVSNVYSGNAKGLVAALLRGDCLSGEDMDELRQFWKEAKNRE